MTKGRREKGAKRRKQRTKCPRVVLRPLPSSDAQGHRLPHGERLTETPVPSSAASRAAGSAHITSSRSARSPPLQDCNPQHTQPAPSLTTLPFSHEQRREASRQNGQTSWVGFNHGGPYVLKYPDILGLRLKEQPRLSRGKLSLFPKRA